MKILNKKQCEKFISLAIDRTADYISKNNLKGVSLGISGGIDSAIVGIIGLRAIEKLKKAGYECDYDYMYLDCDSDSFDFERATALAHKFDFKLRTMDLTNWYKLSPLHNDIPKDHPRAKRAEGNIKCRLRMISIYNSAQILGGIYLDTDDLSEELMGFWTKHGDEGDVKIIQHVTKTELYDLGEYLGVPEIILSSKPGDGLKVTKANTAEDQLGLDYLFIEYIMSRAVGVGFDYNGSLKQLDEFKIKTLVERLAEDLKKSKEQVYKILKQSLATAYKRKYGDNVVHLLPSRVEFGFLEFGSDEFNNRWLETICRAF
jgi:NAD+ synthase